MLAITDLIYHFYVLPINFIFIMETSNANKKFLALMAEIMSDDIKKFKYSPQDIIELYCLVREKEDLLQKRKGQIFAGGAALSLRLGALAAMKHHLAEIYMFVAKDEAGAAKLERWYYMYQQDKIKKPKVISAEVAARPKKVATQMGIKNSSLLMGMRKDAYMQATHKRLTEECVWKGEKKKTSISQADMKRFFFTLCLDEYWLGLLQHNVYVAIDIDKRLKVLVKSRLLLKEYFQFNYNKDPESEFEAWMSAIRLVLGKDIELLEKVVKNARNVEELLSAHRDFNNFWQQFLPFDDEQKGFNMTSMVGVGVEPEDKMLVLEQLACLEQNNWKAKEDLLAVVLQSNADTIAIEAKHFPLMIKDLKKMKQVKRLVVLTKESLNEGVFVLSCE